MDDNNNNNFQLGTRLSLKSPLLPAHRSFTLLAFSRSLPLTLAYLLLPIVVGAAAAPSAAANAAAAAGYRYCCSFYCSIHLLTFAFATHSCSLQSSQSGAAAAASASASASSKRDVASSRSLEIAVSRASPLMRSWEALRRSSLTHW